MIFRPRPKVSAAGERQDLLSCKEPEHDRSSVRTVAFICEENASCVPAPSNGSSAMQQQRCHFKQIDSLEERSAEEALRLKRLVHALEIKREWLLKEGEAVRGRLAEERVAATSRAATEIGAFIGLNADHCPSLSCVLANAAKVLWYYANAAAQASLDITMSAFFPPAKFSCLLIGDGSLLVECGKHC